MALSPSIPAKQIITRCIDVLPMMLADSMRHIAHPTKKKIIDNRRGTKDFRLYLILFLISPHPRQPKVSVSSKYIFYLHN